MSSRARPSPSEAAVGSPRIPVGLTSLRRPSRSSLAISLSGVRVPITTSSWRTSEGSRASSIEVSLRPACASPPSMLGEKHSRSSPSRIAVVEALASAAALPPCPETTTTPRNDERAERTTSVRTAASTSVPIEMVPMNSWCSPLAPMPSGGATSTSSRRWASRSHSSLATIVSVPSGRWGPCCSVEPRGTTRRVPHPRRASSWEVTWSSRVAEMVTPRC